MSNEKGFSLVEIMVSLVVLLIVFLGLMQGALLAIDTNTRNLLREEAVSIADMRMNEARDAQFPAALIPLLPAPDVTRDFRNMSITFGTARAVNFLDANNAEVGITVTWAWKGQPYTLTTTTIVRNPS